tara:strand:- start:1108 stop:1752 length:645 start_codon:yes stop_codon:yes gene_type:complete
MHYTINNLLSVNNEIEKKINKKSNIIAVSKTFSAEKIMPLLEHGHNHFGENKVKEALEKWTVLKKNFTNVKLHLIGKLQTNKVKHALNLFDYIHSVDNIKLATKISNEQKKINKKPKIFIQINIGNEPQKSGIDKKELKNFYQACIELGLDIIGTMCLPPNNDKSDQYFSEMQTLNESLNLKEISMGMSEDYLNAAEHGATFIRIGSKIFGPRS